MLRYRIHGSHLLCDITAKQAQYHLRHRNMSFLLQSLTYDRTANGEYQV